MTRARGIDWKTWAARMAVVAASAWIAWAVRKVFLTTNASIMGDGQLGIHYWEVARAAFQQDHAFPLWNRSMCAGYPHLSNPETPIISSVIVGVFNIRGDMMQRWYPTVLTFVGVLGTYAWARKALSLQRMPALLAGGLFVASGFPSAHFAGHMSFVPFAFIPWVLYFARIGETDLRGAIGVGATLALMAIEGGTYPVPFAIVALAVTETPRMFTRAVGPVRVARLAAVSAVTLALLGGIKLYPAMIQLMREPRILQQRDFLTWTELFPMLIDKDRFGGFPPHPFVWDEYRDYLGPLAVGMGIAGAGAAMILKPRRWAAVLLLFAGLLLARGVYSPTSPYALLLKLPVFGQLRVPSRYMVLASLGIAGCAGVALQVAREHLKSRVWSGVVLVVALCALLDPIGAGQTVHKAYINQHWLPRPDERPAANYHFVVDDGTFTLLPQRNLGIVNCLRAWAGVPDAAGFVLGDVAQVTPAAGTNALVSNVEMHQNGVVFNAVLPRDGIIHVNQSYDPDWKSNVGTVRKGLHGDLELQLAAGNHAVSMRYRPAGLTSGLIATVLGLLLSIGVLWRGRRWVRA